MTALRLLGLVLVWSMVDAAIVFSVVAVANGFLYPVFFRPAPVNAGSGASP